jgi:4-hydroxy-3-methylbut-2-enyl diphosphate reductase
VTKVQMEVLRYARDGFTIIFVGHRNHDEAIGTVGEARLRSSWSNRPKRSRRWR